MNYANKDSLVDWLSDKIKTRDYLNSSTPADVRKSLVSASKIVKNFENPKTGNENLRQDTSSDTGQGAENIPRYHIEAERSEKAGRNVISSNQASSGADTPGL